MQEGRNPFQTLRSTRSLHTHVQPENGVVSEVWLCLQSVGGGAVSGLRLVAEGVGWEAELSPRGLPLLRVWRSTSNLFAVIAVRANTLESSNSLFYFSHHEGDHLSSCPPALPAQPAAGVRSSSPGCPEHELTPARVHAKTQTQHGQILFLSLSFRFFCSGGFDA